MKTDVIRKTKESLSFFRVIMYSFVMRNGCFTDRVSNFSQNDSTHCGIIDIIKIKTSVESN